VTITLTISRTNKAAPPANLQPVSSRGSGGWLTVVRDPYPGAWQRNDELYPENVLSYFAIFACVTLIAGDMGKVGLRLVQQTSDGIWVPAVSPAFSPVLRKPNRYQTTNKFVEQWNVSKLVHGNTYALKQRDARRIVTALYILNPLRVKPLVAPDGGVYYELNPDDLSELKQAIIVPASEIIHDTMIALYHPLCGVSPLYACGLPALQGLKIERNSAAFFGNGSQPGGVLTAPGAISDDAATKAKTDWEAAFQGDHFGRVAVLGDGLKYEPLALSAVDAQLIEQLRWSAEAVCSCYHVPPYMIGIGPAPAYGTVEPLVQQYYSQCLQVLMNGMEKALDDGLGIATPTADGIQYGTEFDIDDLIWMDTRTRADAATKSSGTLSPNEARQKFFGMGPVDGGESPMVQQQYYSLQALAERDAEQPFSKPAAATPPPAVTRAALDAALRKRIA